MIIRVLLGVLIGGVAGAVLGHFGKCSTGACPLTANPYRGAVYGAAMAILFVMVSAGGRTEERKVHEPQEKLTGHSAEAKQTVIEIETESDFQSRVVEGEGVFLVDFFSYECPPCRALLPVLSNLGEKYAGKVTVCKVDVQETPELAREYGVQAIPVVLIIKGGEEITRMVGLRPETEYAAVLDRLLEGGSQ
ncbi:MAG: thioredoxin fold domain-containing protein [Phycisphaerales bacterium]|nr:MAG: thioredoxin fold domain-containing protein [Phycisphaerales bacterium]